ncbi:MAG: ATP-binding protein [Bradymonadia bacterium]
MLGPSLSGRRRMFWSVYLHGVLMLVVVALVVGVLAWSAGGRPFWQQLERGAQASLSTASDLSDLQRRMDHLNVLLGASGAVFGPDGTVIAAAGDAPPAAIPADEYADLNHDEHTHYRHDGRVHLALLLNEGPMVPRGAYLAVSWRDTKSPLKFIGALISILGVLALASIPLARHIARPIERLTATAQALGAGDLSARTGLERKDEVGALARAMDEMASRIDHMLSAEREMLANISHELRTPLARIRVALELSQQDPSFLADIEQDLGELEMLVADVLASARLGQEGLPLHLAPLDPEAVVHAAAERLRARHRDVDLSVHTHLDDIPNVHADPALIRRVLDNLLENAMKHGAPPISLSVRGDAARLTFEVADQGPGITEADRAQVFEPFYRADRSRTRGTGGVGLGLSLCKRIVEAHGGTIEVRPGTENGSVFSFTLMTA